MGNETSADKRGNEGDEDVKIPDITLLKDWNKNDQQYNMFDSTVIEDLKNKTKKQEEK